MEGLLKEGPPIFLIAHRILELLRRRRAPCPKPMRNRRSLLCNPSIHTEMGERRRGRFLHLIGARPHALPDGRDHDISELCLWGAGRPKQRSKLDHAAQHELPHKQSGLWPWGSRARQRPISMYNVKRITAPRCDLKRLPCPDASRCSIVFAGVRLARVACVGGSAHALWVQS